MFSYLQCQNTTTALPVKLCYILVNVMSEALGGEYHGVERPVWNSFIEYGGLLVMERSSTQKLLWHL